MFSRISNLKLTTVFQHKRKVAIAAILLTSVTLAPYSFTTTKGEPTPADIRKGILNLKFYSNEIKSQPHGDYIDIIHTQWNYNKLEGHHGYIQWLFPIKDQGVNPEAQPLFAQEISGIRNHKTRILQSYRLMLNFYGLNFDSNSGKIEKNSNWKERFQNLSKNPHNYLRISRIITSLGLLGYPHFQKPLVEFFLIEIKNGELPNAKESLQNYWIPAVDDQEEQNELISILNQ